MFLVHLFAAYSQNELCICHYDANDGDFDVVKLDEIMTKTLFRVMFL